MRSHPGRNPWPPLAVVTIGLAVLASCSSSDDASSVTTTAPSAAPTTTVEASADAEVEAAAASEAVGDDAEPSAPSWAVDVAIAVPGADVIADVSVDFDPQQPDELDPFGRFASCSGLREWFVTYSVVVSDPENEIGGASISTMEPVAAPGIYDAGIRVDDVDGARVVATGTMTIDPGFRSGSFVGFDVLGAEVSGTFECSGSDLEPAPLTVGLPDDGELETVEVAAQLESPDGAERVVSLAATSDGSADVECPATGGLAGPVVRVDGDQSIGALTEFSLSNDEPAELVMRVGGVVYESTDVAVTLAPDASSGSYAGVTAAGVAIDGAFRCE